MANRTNSERHIAHIKDIFPSPRESGVATSHTTSDSNSSIQNSSGDVFFVKAKNSTENSSDSSPRRDSVVTSSRVRIPSSRKKRPAPKPPEIQSLPVTDKQRTSATVTQSVSNNTETTADHLDPSQTANPSPYGQTFPNDNVSSLSGQTRVANGPVSVSKDVNKPTTTVSSGGNSLPTGARGDQDSSMEPRIRSPVQLTGSQASNQTIQDTGLGSDRVCATSTLSDSGTTSNSSGYQSEDVPDQAPGLPMDKTNPNTHSERADDGFEEEGFTLDFEEEDEALTEGRHTVLYKEYQGEDFSRYLQDDPDHGLAPDTPELRPRRTRYHKHKDTSSSSSGSSTLDNPKKKGFREKFSQMFTLSKQHRTKDQRHPIPYSGNIQSFSFADSKIGVILDNSGVPGDKHVATDPNQELQDVGLPKSWWNTDTLSARSLKNNSDIMVRKKRSSSVGDILDREHSNPNAHAYNQRDFESYRKSKMYDSKDKFGSKKGTFWSKFTRTLKKKDGLSDPENMAVNPLTSGSGVKTSAGDVRL